jgi:flagellar assembly protein FliH
MLSRIIRAASQESKTVISFPFGQATTLVEAIPVEQPPLATSLVTNEIPAAPQPDVKITSLQAAEQQAELVLRQARLEASEIEKQAYERGFSEGEKAGKEVGEKSLEAILKQYARGLDELNNLRKEIFTTSEREVLRLALEIARKVIRREVSVDEELILTLVKVALNRLSEQTIITVRMNPRDYQSIQRHHAAHSSAGTLSEGIKLLEDPSISRGGCLIETESGIIDARIEEQLREIENGLFEQ